MRLFIAILFCSLFSFDNNDIEVKRLYQKAFEEQHLMLKGVKNVDFKYAVFITENAFNKGELNYSNFLADINKISLKIKALVKSRGLETYKTAYNWGVYTYMMDSCAINNYSPFTYDFNDFMGDKDWTRMFVTKLIKTKKGNCHSLPYYYKILCENLGAKAYLALAPNHIYIKHIDEKSQWVNVELTNGGFPRDQWIIQQMAISVEAIKNEIYMKPLSEKESIALTMFDLASAYDFQFGKDNFVLEVVNTGLQYFPKCIPLLMLKANYYKEVIAQKKVTKDVFEEDKKEYNRLIKTIDSLGYKDMPKEIYQEWVKSIENEKLKSK